MDDRVEDAAPTVVDPVCGMTLRPLSAAGMSRFDGQPFYFCSSACHTRVDADPVRFRRRPPGELRAGSCCRPSSSSCH
jgi:Cu+-exporting ATPase